MAEIAGSGSDDDQLVSIHEATRKRNVRQLRRALAAGRSPNMSDGCQSAIHILCRPYYPEQSPPPLGDRLACLDLLRQSPDFDVNLPNSYGEQAIHLLGYRMLTPRRGPSSPLRRVPPEVLRKVAAFAFHVGYY